MAQVNVACPMHNLPYEFVLIAPNATHFLRCKQCPYEPTSLRISSEVQYMKARMGTQKSKQREKQRERSRSRSKSKGKDKQSTEREEEEENQITQKIAQQQVLILQLVMKLLTQDKKKYDQTLQKSILEHKKLWKQYDESTGDVLFLNKLCQKNFLNDYIGFLGAKGWENLKTILKSMYNRAFICQKISKESMKNLEKLEESSKFRKDSVIESLNILISKSLKIKNEQWEEHKNEKEEKKSKSKSFGNLEKIIL